VAPGHRYGVTTPAAPCASGCTLRDRHTTPTPDKHPDDCPGCQPRPTVPGLAVCWRCYYRLVDALTRAPDLVAHIRDHVTPGSAVRQEGTRGKRPAPPAPLNVTAVADADDLHALLASWAGVILTDHPDHLTGPSWSGTRLLPARRRPNTPVYLDPEPAGLTTTGDWHATAAVTRWIYTHHEWALTQEWAGDLTTEVTTLVATLRGRYPVEERPTYTGAPCPNCGRPSLIRYAPTCWQGPVTITCADCGTTVPEKLYGAYVRVLLAERRAQARAATP